MNFNLESRHIFIEKPIFASSSLEFGKVCARKLSKNSRDVGDVKWQIDRMDFEWNSLTDFITHVLPYSVDKK